MTTKAVRLRVTGRVQGVSFRYYTQEEARRLGVAGWVRNDPDGSVEVYAEGSTEAVDALVAWCHEGPTLARVRSVALTPQQPGGAAGFEVRH